MPICDFACGRRMRFCGRCSIRARYTECRVTARKYRLPAKAIVVTSFKNGYVNAGFTSPNHKPARMRVLLLNAHDEYSEVFTSTESLFHLTCGGSSLMAAQFCHIEMLDNLNRVTPSVLSTSETFHLFYENLCKSNVYNNSGANRMMHPG